MLNKSGPSIDPWGTPVLMFCQLLKTFSTFIRCLRSDNHLGILEMLMTNHKNATSQLVGPDLDSRKLLRDLLKEFQKLRNYRLQVSISQAFPAGIYLFKVNSRNTRTRCEICSGVFIVNFEHISHLVLVLLLLTLNM